MKRQRDLASSTHTSIKFCVRICHLIYHDHTNVILCFNTNEYIDKGKDESKKKLYNIRVQCEM